MANLIDEDPPENEEDAPESGEIPAPILELETDEESVTYELHKTPDGFEVIVVEEADEGEDANIEHTVCLATSLVELDEAIDCLRQMRERMIQEGAK